MQLLEERKLINNTIAEGIKRLKNIKPITYQQKHSSLFNLFFVLIIKIWVKEEVERIKLNEEIARLEKLKAALQGDFLRDFCISFVGKIKNLQTRKEYLTSRKQTLKSDIKFYSSFLKKFRSSTDLTFYIVASIASLILLSEIIPVVIAGFTLVAIVNAIFNPIIIITLLTVAAFLIAQELIDFPVDLYLYARRIQLDMTLEELSEMELVLCIYDQCNSTVKALEATLPNPSLEHETIGNIYTSDVLLRNAREFHGPQDPWAPESEEDVCELDEVRLKPPQSDLTKGGSIESFLVESVTHSPS